VFAGWARTGNHNRKPRGGRAAVLVIASVVVSCAASPGPGVPAANLTSVVPATAPRRDDRPPLDLSSVARAITSVSSYRISLDGHHGNAGPYTLSGIIEPGKARADFDWFPDSPDALRYLEDGRVMYMSGPGFRLPPGKTWVRTPVGRIPPDGHPTLTGAFAVVCGVIFCDVNALLRTLSEHHVAFAESGMASVRGVSVTRFTATVPQLLFTDPDPEIPAQVPPKTVMAELFTDPAGRLRRFSMMITPNPATSITDGSLDVYDYNSTPPITTPVPADVEDMTTVPSS
jgi:hypothetical protein